MSPLSGPRSASDPARERYVAALLRDYAAADATAAHLLCGRHPRERVAFTVIDADLTGRDWTYGELGDAAGRLAAALAARGVGPGDRVATMMAGSAELIVTMLATWHLGAVQVPLFTAFAAPSVALRVAESGARVVVVDPEHRAKVGPGLDTAPIVITTGPAQGADLSWHALLDSGAPVPEPVAVGGDGTLIELFTSGTTGTPKGVPVPLHCVAGMHGYQDYGLHHTDEDVFWNAANPGWAYGLYYAVVGPLAVGRRALLTNGRFNAAFTWAVMLEYGVTNFAAAPTVYRALRNAPEPAPDGLRLRCLSSAGEPLTPEVIDWALEVFGVPVHDHFGQTEIGMLLGNPWHPDLVADVRLGTMGRAFPGFRAEVLRHDADVPAPPGEPGRLAVDCRESPLMSFTGYRGSPERSAQRFSADGRWYYTGDVARRDAEGNVTFEARDDDVILMAGYRIGPFEVERVLAAHDAVAEVAVVGEPDDLLGEVVAAHIVLRRGVGASDELADELRKLVKTGLAAHAYPRKVYFAAALPRTPSGKIERYRLAGRAA